MARGKKAANRRKKQGKSRAWIVLLAVVALIVLSFFLLEKLRTPGPVPPEIKTETPPMDRNKLPPRVDVHPVEMQPYTSATPAPAPARKKRATGHGTIAIIVDDMGSSVSEVRELESIHVPLTFSVIPGLGKGREVAEEAHRKGYQVMIHLPMEPKGYPQQRLESNGLLLSQDDVEIGRRMRTYFAAVPHAVGANNHMGSRFTEDEGKMRAALSSLQEKGMFFIDSRTSPRSVGQSVAAGMGLETGTRNVFLDNVQDVGAIRKQMDQLAALARKRGSAIGICHPHRATIQALKSGLPALQAEGINFVYASELVR